MGGSKSSSKSSWSAALILMVLLAMVPLGTAADAQAAYLPVSGVRAFECQSSHHESIDVAITAINSAGTPYVAFNGLSFGLTVSSPAGVVAERSWPPAGVRYIQSDQSYLVCERISGLSPGTDYRVDTWMVDSGTTFTHSLTLSTPALPPPPPAPTPPAQPVTPAPSPPTPSPATPVPAEPPTPSAPGSAAGPVGQPPQSSPTLPIEARPAQPDARPEFAQPPLSAADSVTAAPDASGPGATQLESDTVDALSSTVQPERSEGPILEFIGRLVRRLVALFRG
jgi:hypothetical protein